MSIPTVSKHLGIRWVLLTFFGNDKFSIESYPPSVFALLREYMIEIEYLKCFKGFIDLMFVAQLLPVGHSMGYEH